MVAATLAVLIVGAVFASTLFPSRGVRIWENIGGSLLAGGIALAATVGCLKIAYEAWRREVSGWRTSTTSIILLAVALAFCIMLLHSAPLAL